MLWACTLGPLGVLGPGSWPWAGPIPWILVPRPLGMGLLAGLGPWAQGPWPWTFRPMPPAQALRLRPCPGSLALRLGSLALAMQPGQRSFATGLTALDQNA